MAGVPAVAGLFQRVILQSGSSLCPWAVEPEPYDAAAVLSADVDCSSGDRECLLSKSAEQLVKANHRRMVRLMASWLCGPQCLTGIQFAR